MTIAARNSLTLAPLFKSIVATLLAVSWFAAVAGGELFPETIRLDQANSVYTLEQGFRFYEDPTAALTLDQVSQPAFAKKFDTVDTGNLSFGFTDSAIWLNFQVQNDGPRRIGWLLEFDYPLLDRIDLYASDGTGGWETITSGDRLVFSERPYPHRKPLLPLSPRSRVPTQYFVRIVTESSMQIRPSIYAEKFYLNASGRTELFFGVVYGVMLLMAVYNGFLYFAIRETTYLLYTVSVVSATAFLMAFYGHSYQYLWPELPAQANLMNPLTCAVWLVASALFTQRFLDTRQHTPTLHRVLDVLVGIGAVAILLAFATRYSVAMRFSTAAAVLNGLIILIAGMVCWVRGNRSARFFTIAWLAHGAGTAMLALSRLSIIPDNFITLNSAALGIVAEIVLLSLALSDRYRLLAKQLESYSHNLEHEVSIRTAELELALEQVRELSLVDPLTQLANRRRFDEYLDTEWQRHARVDRPLSLLMCDVDQFKPFNDRYGHQQGDACLRRVAAAMRAVAHRPADVVARYGGEEFALILPETDRAGAIRVAEDIREAIQALDIPHSDSSISNAVTISIGLADTHSGEIDSIEELIEQADNALYEAKRLGRNRVVSVDPKPAAETSALR